MTQPQPVHPTTAGIGTSIVRTFVPIVVALLVRAGAKVGLDLDPGLFLEVVTVIITTIYYVVVRLLETRVAPIWGWLLGVAKVPAYPTAINTTAVEAPPVGGGPRYGD